MSSVPQTPSEKVYVCFLPPNITEQETKAMFAPFGTIKLFQLNKRHDGFTFAYITYETVKQAQDAIIVMNKMKILDKVLKVDFAAPNCIPKKRRLREVREKLKQVQLSSNSAKPSYDEVRIGNPEAQKSKRQIKREKQRQKQPNVKEMTLLQSEDTQNLYLEKVEKALKQILELKNQLTFKKKEQKEKKTIKQNKPIEDKKLEKEPEETNQVAEEPEESEESEKPKMPEKQKKPEKTEQEYPSESEKKSKICLADLNIFRSWLKERGDVKKLYEAEETEWDDTIDLSDLRENKDS